MKDLHKVKMIDWMGRAGGDSETVDLDASWFGRQGRKTRSGM